MHTCTKVVKILIIHTTEKDGKLTSKVNWGAGEACVAGGHVSQGRHVLQGDMCRRGHVSQGGDMCCIETIIQKD